MAAAAAGKKGSEQVDAKACAESGFSEELQCKTCDRLRDALPRDGREGSDEAEPLVEQCRSCCQAGGDEVFAKALLYVCPSQMEDNQDVEDFVKKKAEQLEGLTVKVVPGARLTLQLLREGEDESDSTEYVNLRGWKTDEIRDFVAMKLGIAGGR